MDDVGHNQDAEADYAIDDLPTVYEKRRLRFHDRSRLLMAMIFSSTFCALAVIAEVSLVTRHRPVSELLEPMGAVGALAGIALGFYFVKEE